MLVIKATKRLDRKDPLTGEVIKDEEPIGYVIDVDGQVPESYVKYVPNKIFDRKKYPELYHLFGKYRMPTQSELDMFTKKHNDWYEPKKKSIFKRIFKWFF